MAYTQLYLSLAAKTPHQHNNYLVSYDKFLCNTYLWWWYDCSDSNKCDEVSDTPCHILHTYTTPSLSLSLDKSKIYNVVVALYYIWQGEMKYLNIQDHVAFGAIPPDVEHSDEYLHTQGLVGVIQWVSYEHKWIIMLADLSLYCFRATHWSLLYLPQREQSFSWFSLSDHVIGGQIML